MIHIPQDWRDKALHGLNLFRHLDQLYVNRKKIAVALRVWAVAVGVSIAAHLAGIWHILAAQVAGYVRTLVPHAMVSVQPVNMSNQLIYICSWIAVPIVVRSILAGASRHKKSWAWYFVRFLLASLWIGVAIVLATSIASVAISWGSGIRLTIGAGRFFAGFICPAVGVLLLWLVALYMVRAALTGLTFGAAFLLQGKGFVDAYLRGGRLFNNHWPYVGGVLLYFFVVHAFLQMVVVPAAPAGSVWAVGASGLSYALWPLYWAIVLPYHKRAVRRR